MDENNSQTRFKAYLYHYLVISFAIAGIAYLLVEHVAPLRDWLASFPFEDAGSTTPGRLRALAYLLLGYVLVIPPYAYKFEKALNSAMPPKKTIADKIFFTLFGFIFFGFLVLFPFIFVLAENVAPGRAGLVYTAFTGSYVGLALLGAFLLYAVTFATWMLVFRIPQLWSRG